MCIRDRRNIEIRKSVVKAAQSASSLKDKVMISDLSMKQVDAEMYQIDMNISNENDFSCDVFPMLGCTATMVVDDWGREETVETYINGSDTVYGRSVSLKIDAEKFEPLESVGLAPHETKKVIYTIAKEDVTDITSLNGNPDTIYGDVKELKDIKPVSYTHLDYKLYLGFIDLKGNLKDQGALWVFLYRCLNIKDVVNGISVICNKL